MALACQKRKERMPEIGDAVAKSDYDIVAFQEVIRFLFTTFLHSDRYNTVVFSCIESCLNISGMFKSLFTIEGIETSKH